MNLQSSVPTLWPDGRLILSIVRAGGSIARGQTKRPKIPAVELAQDYSSFRCDWSFRAALFLFCDPNTGDLTLSGDFSIIISQVINSETEQRPRHPQGLSVPLAKVVGLAIFVVGAFAGYVLGTQNYLLVVPASRQQSEATRTSSTTDSTATWQTYTNRRHGYRIKHPSNLSADVTKGENTLIINFPGPSDIPLLRIDVYHTELDPTDWWGQEGQLRYPWLFNIALNHVEPSNPDRYGELAGLKGAEVVAQRRSPGATILPASILLLLKDDRLFVVFDDTYLGANGSNEDNWHKMLSTFRFVRRGVGG
jgi:hypothetical protein